jgi:ribose 5-phosphate isomerase B
MKIAIAADHGGYKLKQKLIVFLTKKGYEVIDVGTSNINSVDYPDYAFKLGKKLRDKEARFGIALCTSGIGMSVACNKVNGVRCALISNKKEAVHGREQDDLNAIALRGNMTLLTAEEIIMTFLTTPFSKELKYQRRVNKIMQYEESNER